MVNHQNLLKTIFLVGIAVWIYTTGWSQTAAEAPATAEPPREKSVIERWLDTNSGVKSIQVDFIQIKKMRTLKTTIRKPGNLWLNYETGQFRWQLGDPPQTIVTKPDDNLYIIRVPGKKFERRPPGTGDTPAGMASMASGFPRTIEEFHEKYHVIAIDLAQNVHRIVTRPKGEAGRGVNHFVFVVGRDDYRLRGMEIHLADGSSIATEFTRVLPNLSLSPDVFRPNISGYKEAKF